MRFFDYVIPVIPYIDPESALGTRMTDYFDNPVAELLGDEGIPADDKRCVCKCPLINLSILQTGFRGKPVILNFWASTCGPCQHEMPEFQSAHEQQGSQVQFVMVNAPDFNGDERST